MDDFNNNSININAIISLILGIFSIIFSFGILIFPLAFGITAIVLSNNAASANKLTIQDEKYAKVGKIFGIVGIILGIIWVIVYIGLFVFVVQLSVFVDSVFPH